MAHYWRPSRLAKRLGSSGDWVLTLTGSTVQLRIAEASTRASIAEVGPPVRGRSLWFATVTFELHGRPVTLAGMRRRDATSMLHALKAAHDSNQQLRQGADILAWAAAFQTAVKIEVSTRGWLGRDFRNQWEASKPEGPLTAALADPSLPERLGSSPGALQDAVVLWNSELRDYLGQRNEQHLRSEARAARDFFDRIERSPLTAEQVRAVVCLDNRVQVVASAGSGKTSTMVAKAGYVLHRNLIPAEKILLLAFNTDAAKELEQRIRDRLTPLGLAGDRVQAKTFHAFGLEVIGQASGRKPSLASWVTDGADLEKLTQLVDKLRDTDPAFRLQWDFFRLVLSRELPEFGQESKNPSDWDPTAQSAGFRTRQGEVVKSQGERLIADWLFYNGVPYLYERPYEHETVDATHGQYHPDFYYPSIDAYHEHFALNRHGQPPPEFTGYLDGVIWKRAVHAKFGTTLLETTMSELWDGKAFERLSGQLTALGITLDPNPDRVGSGPAPIKNAQLIRTFRTFLIHAKSNRLDAGPLRERLRAWSGTPSHFRHGVFLNLFDSIRAAWDQELARHGVIDFEDMLTLAADHLEAGHWDPEYELVMVDEMQDASHARARLARALVDVPGRMLFAVGDDWQSINGFAGADLSVMTDFARWFGDAETIRLERTFRSPQSLCSVSSAFVLKNPGQLRKSVISAAADYSPAIVAVALESDAHYQHTVQRHLEQLAARLVSGEIRAGANHKVTVLVLCRYRKVLQEVSRAARPGSSTVTGWDRLEVSFHTIHGAKGLEADYVIMVGLTQGAYGFPSTIADDPVLQLAMPAGDAFPFAEERRLFYVALTRAKRSVLLLTVTGKESPFLLELVQEHNIAVLDASGRKTAAVRCPACGEGQLVQRKGKFGSFLGCSRFPGCRHTRKAEVIRSSSS